MSDDAPSCPKCRRELLVPAVSADTASPPLECPSCKGMWFEEADAQRIVEGDSLQELPHTGETSSSLDDRVGMCPYGHAILTRAKVDTEPPFHLDRCAKCGGIWFDQGEWTRLASQHTLHALRDLWKPVLRKQLQQAQAAVSQDEELEALLGKELFARATQIAADLREHPHREAAVDLILRRSSTVRLVRGERGAKHEEGSSPPDEPPDDVA